MKIVPMVSRGATIHNLDLRTDAFGQHHAPTLVPVLLTLHLLLHLHQVLGQARVPKHARRMVIHRFALRHLHCFGERVGHTKNGTGELLNGLRVILRVMRHSVFQHTCTLQELAEAAEVVGALELLELRTCNAAHELVVTIAGEAEEGVALVLVPLRVLLVACGRPKGVKGKALQKVARRESAAGRNAGAGGQRAHTSRCLMCSFSSWSIFFLCGSSWMYGSSWTFLGKRCS